MNLQIRKNLVFKWVALASLLGSTSLQSDQLLVIGDSWAWQRVSTLQTVLEQNGHEDIEVIQAPTRLYASGLKLPDRLQELTRLFRDYPDATMVHLSIGGNDMETITPSVAGTPEESARLETLIEDVDTIVDHMVFLRPDIQILWSSYDFQRPRPSLGTPHEVNSTYLRLTERSMEYALSRSENMTYSDINGLLQVTYGFDGIPHTEFDPSEPIPPGDPSLPDPELPSPIQPFKVGDASHLTESGYQVLAEAQYAEYYGPLLNGDSFQINPGLNDAWFDPATNGQGFFIIVFESIPLVMLSWFTYDTERPPQDVTAILGEPGHRWITAQGGFVGSTADLTIYKSSGGVFDSSVPAVGPPEDIGSMTVTFTDCNSGVVNYDIPSLGLSGSVPIQRLAPDNIVICEAFQLEE
jgi:lysophospholipase L1-like esterase